MKSTVALSCKCGEKFSVHDLELLDDSKPIGYKIKSTHKCPKCGEDVNCNLVHRGTGTYMPVEDKE
jgi:hypothetical protein